VNCVMFRRLAPSLFCALFLVSCATRQDSVPEDIAPTAAETFTATFQVQAPTDDAEELFGRATVVGNTAINLGVYSGYARRVGLRLNGLAIPPGAQIDSAVIELRAAESRSFGANFTITGEASDNASTFAHTVNNIDLRPKTQASVAWQPTPWVSGTTYEATSEPIALITYGESKLTALPKARPSNHSPSLGAITEKCEGSLTAWAICRA